MPRKRKPPIKSRLAPRDKSRTGRRQIVTVDQEPLRSEAIGQCGMLMAGIDTARGDLERFEREDRPAFERWMAATFGHALTELRELSARFMEKSALAQEIEMEMVFGRCRSHHEAYRIVMLRRERAATGTPPEAEEDERASETFTADPDGDEGGLDVDEFMMAEMFDSFVIDVLGLNPARMDDNDYAAMFENFKRTVFGKGGGGPKQDSTNAPREFPSATSAPREARVKELYRLLVRRLHPDTRADGDPTVAEVWHEVQAAYASGDLERLETLLAFADVREKRFGPHTTLSQLRAVAAELKRTLNALRKSLRGARKDRAWSFATAGNRAGIEQKIRRELARDLATQRADLEDVERLLASWSQPASRPARARARRKNFGRQQGEFAF